MCDTKADARDRVHEVGHAERAQSSVPPELGRTRPGLVGEYMSTVVHLHPTTSGCTSELPHILRRFGPCRLNQLRPLDIKAWLAEPLGGGMAPSSVHPKYRVLQCLLQVASTRN